MPTVTTLCEETGISYRQANHWISKGYIPDVITTGSGNHLSLNGHQSDIFKVMATLVQVGFVPKQAAAIASIFVSNDGFYGVVHPNLVVSIRGVSDKQHQTEE